MRRVEMNGESLMVAAKARIRNLFSDLVNYRPVVRNTVPPAPL